MDVDFSAMMEGQDGELAMQMPSTSAMSEKISINVPPSIPIETLTAVLGQSDGAAPITEERLRAPDAALILHIYQTLLSIPQLQAAANASRQEQDRRIVDMETQLHDAERLQAEAEARAEESRLAKEQALAEKSQVSSQLAQAQGTLTSLQSSSETGVQRSAEVKGRLEQVEQEKRSLLEVLEREKMESNRRAEEIESLNTRSREARSEIMRLSSDFQEAKSAEGTARFRMQSLEQELALKANDATWAHNELNKATEELAALRVKMQAEITSLNSRTHQVTQELEAAQSKISTLQGAYDSTLTRLEEATREKSELRQRIVEQESAFKSELSTQQRLNDLVTQQKDNAERRLRDVEEQWETILSEYRDREEALREEIGREQSMREEVAREKDDIQQALDRLAESVGLDITHGNGNGDAAVDITIDSTPGMPNTPTRFSQSNTSNLGPSSIMSPTAALASRVQKSGKSFTQVYAELAKTQEELRREKLESSRLGNVLEQVMADLQERAPALQAQREETERLGRDLEEISATLARACEERDAAERDAKNMRLEAEGNQRENTLLNRQLGDLAQQVRELSREIIIRDNPAAAEDMAPDGSQIGSSTSATLAEVSNTQSVISAELVTFRSLTDLITQNERLLRVIRELGTKMEAEESKYRANVEEQESEAIEEARVVITRLQEEIRAERTRTDSIRRERDMFRSMTAQGRASSSIATSLPSTSQENNAAHVALTTQYNQLQEQFEALRSETSNDMERLKEEAHHARSEASRSALSAAREKAARDGLEDRLANAQQTYALERKELQELQRRHTSLQEALTKQEVAAQSFSQQLITAHSTIERLRNEVSNLSAERQLHKETTERLMSEKESALRERTSLSELLRSSQSMQSDMERSNGEIRRRLESQLEKLEEQSKDLRDHLSKEEEAHRQTSMRRDVETTDLRGKLDRVNEEVSKAREELAVAKNSLQHLSQRADDLQRQVDAKDEKLAVYERRSTLSSATGNVAQANLTSEQQIKVELAEVKGELRGAQVEVEQAKAHIEQYKSIASSNEEALAQLQSTYEQYQETTQASIAQKDSELKSLRERSEMLATELTKAQAEATSERQERQSQASAFAAEKKTLEDALSEMAQVEDRARVAQQAVQEEIRKHAQAAQEAHRRYESELMAHAEDIKTLTSVKEQVKDLRNQQLEAQKARETAEGNLANSQDSWNVQKSILEREKDEQKRIVAELRSHNEALHTHLETVQAQANEIRQAATGQGNVGDTSVSSQSGSDELQEVIKYLRREKEIVDLQVELREQECARLRQSVDRTQKSLDETRIQLAQEREQNSGASASAKQHEELMEKINQLSILRESNTTLRDELERAQRRVQSLEARVESLTRELDPLREEVRVKAVELEALQQQLTLTQEDNKRWQGRTQSILQQYNRIDPDELKNLQDQKKAIEASLEEQKSQFEAKEKELESVSAERDSLRDKFDRIRAQAQERIKGLNGRIGELQGELTRAKEEQANEQSNTNDAAILSLQAEVDNLKVEKQQQEEKTAALEAEKLELSTQVKNLQEHSVAVANTSDGNADEAVRKAVDEAQKTWDIERQQLEAKHQATERREQMHHQKAKEFNTQMKNAQRELEEVKKAKEEEEARLKAEWSENNSAEIERAVNERIANGAANAEGSTGGAALQQRITELEHQLEAANARIRELEATGASTSDGHQSQEQIEASLREQEERLSKQYMERQKQAVEIAISKARSAGASASTNVEEQVQQRLKAFEDQREQDLAAAIASKEQELKAQMDEQLKARYEAGKEEASLRNKLLIKTKDTKIEKLTAELNQLKGIAPAAAPATAAATAQAAPAAAANAARGGVAPRPLPRPLPSPTGQVGAHPSPGGQVRGGAPIRGGIAGRGGAQGAAAGAQKRKIEQRQSTGGEEDGEGATEEDGNAPSGGAGNANLPKKPRPAGGPITIRGGAGGQRGGASSRGGRGGSNAGSG